MLRETTWPSKDFFVQISDQELKELETLLKQENPNLEITRDELLKLAQKTLTMVAIVYSENNDSEDLPL